MPFKAIIFDFDGVITDTEPIHMEAWLEVLDQFGISFDDEEYKANYLGLNDREFLDVVGRLHGHFFSDADKANLQEQKIVLCLNMLEHDIPILPGVREFVEAVSKKCLLGICSGANRTEIDFILKHLKWNGLFNPVVSAESVKKGKPDPEGYIRAIEALIERASEPILTEEILAIEDSPKGVAAAKASGIACLAVGAGLVNDKPAGADHVIASLADISDVNDILNHAWLKK